MNVLLNDDYKKNNIKFNQFIDDLDQTIHELTLKFYPDLFEKDEKIIKEYRNLLINTTLSFSEKINKLLHSNF